MTTYYNPRTRQVVGCKRGSLTWYHEWRHRLQDLGGWVDAGNYVRLAFVFGAFVSAAVAIKLPSLVMNSLTFVLVLISVLPELLLEVDAWVYAVRRKWF